MDSIYKISINSKDEAQEFFKLIKALFILQSNDDIEYDFKPILNEEGSLDFCYNLIKIDYNNLSSFIKQEVEVKQEDIKRYTSFNGELLSKLETLKTEVDRQKEEYLNKERQIASFLECKKSFFGRVRYFFKKPQKGKHAKDVASVEDKIEKLQNEIDIKNSLKSENSIEDNQEAKNIEKIEEKELYTIEDLLKVCENLRVEETKHKNMQMDIKALDEKTKSLERKIQNATLYINEIESHKKSLFEFWKFTNKDESNMLVEGEEVNKEGSNKLRKEFSFEEDIELFGKRVDAKQDAAFSKNECDAVFAIRNDLTTFNLLNKEKLLKKDDDLIEKTLKKFKKEYSDNIDVIKSKDFDIFGNVAEDKTKIKTLKNNKHREIEKDKYKILDIKPDTTLEEYKDNILNYLNILKHAYGKMKSSYDLSLYKVSTEDLSDDCYDIFDLNAKEEVGLLKDEDTIYLYRINIKENMPLIFYSNIMYFDNLNRTLPEGMDIETKVLIDLSKFDLKLVSTKEFNVNIIDTIDKNKIQLFKTYEYDLELKEENSTIGEEDKEKEILEESAVVEEDKDKDIDIDIDKIISDSDDNKKGEEQDD